MRALQHQSQDTEGKIVAIMLAQPSHGTIVGTKNGESACASRDAWLIPPFFWGVVTRCLASILGESQDSKRNPCLDRKAKLAIISAKPERFSGESLEGVLESRSGLIMGDFVDPRFRFNHSCVAGPSTRSGVILSMTGFLSEPDLRLFL